MASDEIIQQQVIESASALLGDAFAVFGGNPILSADLLSEYEYPSIWVHQTLTVVVLEKTPLNLVPLEFGDGVILESVAKRESADPTYLIGTYRFRRRVAMQHYQVVIEG